MLPGGHQGQSELFNSLKAHLNNQNRLQPFIGLSSIIECVNAGSQQRDAFYLCEVCVCRLGKADMRNHIMGSLHRYNYIKARHPDFISGWEEDSALTKVAWPLMDIAKKIEEKEGPGTVQVVEFDKSSYQQMEAQRNNTENIIHFLRHALKESDPETSEMITSQQREQTTSSSQRIVLLSPRKKFEKYTNTIQNSFNYCPQSTTLTHQTCDISQSFQSSPDRFLESSSLLSRYSGPVPLIGLVRVVECKSEDDQTYCFLCHCCRVRSHKHDIIDHLTSASHITNYLMETHPEQLESVDLNDSYQLLLLAQNLKQDEHTTALKVVQVPESLCVLMSSKSYHWCIKRLWQTNTAFPMKHIYVKGQKFSKFLEQGGPRKSNAVQLKRDKMKKLKKFRQKNNPVFRVTLPVTHGSLLVERTSFSKDDFVLCVTHPPSADSQEPQESFDKKENSSADLYSQYQPNDFSEGENEYTEQNLDFKNEQHMDFRNEERINQFEEQNVDKTNADSKVGLCKEDFNSAPLPTVFNNQYWPSYSFSSEVGTREMEGCAVGPPYYYQPQDLSPDYIGQQHTYSSGHFVDGSWIDINPQSGVSFSHNNGMTLSDHRQTQSMACQSHSSYYTEYGANTHQYSSYQVSSSGCGTYQSHCFVPAYSGAVFSGGISGSAFGATSPNVTCYPMYSVSPHFYSSQGCPY